MDGASDGEVGGVGYSALGMDENDEGGGFGHEHYEPIDAEIDSEDSNSSCGLLEGTAPPTEGVCGVDAFADSTAEDK